MCILRLFFWYATNQGAKNTGVEAGQFSGVLLEGTTFSRENGYEVESRSNENSKLTFEFFPLGQKDQNRRKTIMATIFQ